jgi:flagellar biosynthetic protein FliP
VTFGAVLGLILALGLVLGLFGAAVGIARRFANGGSGRSQVGMNVIARTSLGPRQGLAAVRIGGRVVVVSVGEGGVHAVTELTTEEAARLEKDEVRDGVQSRLPFQALQSRHGHQHAARQQASHGWQALLRRGLKAMGGVSVVLMIAAGAMVIDASIAHAQSAQGAGSAAVSAISAARQAGATPQMSFQMGSGAASDFRVSGTVGTVLFMGLLATLPTLLLLMTSFTRVLVVLHFARQALGTQGAPPAHLLAALALLLTGFIMAPTLNEANTLAVQPWMRGEIDEVQMMKTGAEPFRAFMLSQTSDDELVRFVEMSGQPIPNTPEEVSLPILMTAFATGELRAAFQMGFAIFLPFVVIDLVVSAVLTSMGMFMLPPTMIALPCKLLLFVLVDGWSLLLGSLISSFA